MTVRHLFQDCLVHPQKLWQGCLSSSGIDDFLLQNPQTVMLRNIFPSKILDSCCFIRIHIKLTVLCSSFFPADTEIEFSGCRVLRHKLFPAAFGKIQIKRCQIAVFLIQLYCTEGHTANFSIITAPCIRGVRNDSLPFIRHLIAQNNDPERLFFALFIGTEETKKGSRVTRNMMNQAVNSCTFHTILNSILIPVCSSHFCRNNFSCQTCRNAADGFPGIRIGSSFAVHSGIHQFCGIVRLAVRGCRHICIQTFIHLGNCRIHATLCVFHGRRCSSYLFTHPVLCF